MLALLLTMSGCPADKTPITRPEGVRRVISLLPSFTEILIAIDCKENLVGVTSFPPPRARGIRSVGGLVNPDLEAIFTLEPDLVVGMRSHTTSEIERKLTASGVPTLFVPNETLEDAMAAIGAIGDGMGKGGEARDLVAKIMGEMDRVRTQAQAGAKDAPLTRVAVVLQHDPLIVAGKGSFLGQLIDLAGGENIAGDSKAPHPLFSLESFLARAPQVIIDVSEAYEGGADPKRVIQWWNEMPETPARKSGRIHPLEDGLPIDPGPRVPLLLRFIASRIHPERFP